MSDIREADMKIFPIIAAFSAAIILTSCGKDDKRLYCSQNANGSAGDHWGCELVPDGILNEVDYYTTRSPFNFGPGYKENWVFEPMGQGEVTINWTAYTGGNHIDENASFYVVYTVDDDKSITKTFDSRYSD